ncbi:DUF2201 family putative metallopeptidase [Secundilactobacillus silagei]|uniref:DUF2201 family putative metallopeptidase n=1 Tax=Secundilactobacillus silagei TaxID=1293415 RepID=UPI0006D1D611|nr:hypothetical protein [Secundilactobacillus silagei]
MFHTQLNDLANPKDSKAAQQQVQELFATVTSQLLNSQRFYGELLLRLDKRVDSQLPVAIALTTAKRPALLINPQRLNEMVRSDEDLLSLVEHVVSHLAWQHPQRYAGQGADQLVQLATDMAINDHLHPLYPGAVTRQQVNFKLGLHLTADLGSAEYLAQLKLILKKRSRWHQGTAGQKNAGSVPGNPRWLAGTESRGKTAIKSVGGEFVAGDPDQATGVSANTITAPAESATGKTGLRLAQARHGRFKRATKITGTSVQPV